MVKILSQVGFDVAQSSNGKDAIGKWEQWEPHLIFMDMRMPFMDGYNTTKTIKSTEKGQQTNILGITAYACDEEISLILSVGCDDIVYKPIQEEVLYEKISQYLTVDYLYEEITLPI